LTSQSDVFQLHQRTGDGSRGGLFGDETRKSTRARADLEMLPERWSGSRSALLMIEAKVIDHVLSLA
jgi:hypothetical protein